jgi:hypothetical protein
VLTQVGNYGLLFPVKPRQALMVESGCPEYASKPSTAPHGSQQCIDKTLNSVGSAQALLSEPFQ